MSGDLDLPDDLSDPGVPLAGATGGSEARLRPMGRYGVPVGCFGRTARAARAARPVVLAVLTLGLGMWAAHLIAFQRTRARVHLAAAAFHLVTAAVACALVPTDQGALALLWIMLVNWIGGATVLGSLLERSSHGAAMGPTPAGERVTATLPPRPEPWTRAWLRVRVTLWWQALLVLPFGIGSALALLCAGALARRPGWWALAPLHAGAAGGTVALLAIGEDGEAVAFFGGLALGTAAWIAGALQVFALAPHYLLRRRAMRA